MEATCGGSVRWRSEGLDEGEVWMYVNGEMQNEGMVKYVGDHRDV